MTRNFIYNIRKPSMVKNQQGSNVIPIDLFLNPVYFMQDITLWNVPPQKVSVKNKFVDFLPLSFFLSFFFFLSLYLLSEMR